MAREKLLQDFYAVGPMFDMPAVWAEMAEKLQTVAIPQCGHLPQEEQPDIVNKSLLDFLNGWVGRPRRPHGQSVIRSECGNTALQHVSKCPLKRTSVIISA
jgi:hypothetical protein